MTARANFLKVFLIILFVGNLAARQKVSIPSSPEGHLADIFTVKIFSRVLDEERTISVSLPEGETLFPKAIATVKDLNRKELIPETIIVGIWNTDRNRDMIPEVVAHRPGSGGSKKFLLFFKQELVPHIKNTYRASDYAILYGMSNSALFAVYAMLEMPEAFDAVIASSPMIGHCPEHIQEKAETFVQKNLAKTLVLFMIYGTEDSRRVTEYVPDLHKYLNAHAPGGFTCRLEILDGEGHVPASSLARGLANIFVR